MSKKAIILLLLPSVIYLLVAAGSFNFARLLTPREQITQKAIDKLTAEVRHGDYSTNSNLLAERLSDSWRSRDMLQSIVAKMYLVTGWTVLSGVAVQVYLVLRLRYGLKKQDAQPHAQANQMTTEK